jgi:RNA polymerase sigma factor (sigma-70 family)
MEFTMSHSADNLIHCLRALVDPARHETATDGTLLGRWLAERDERAFAALVWRHGPLVWRVCRNLLSRPEDAEDAFQATFLVLSRKAASLRRRQSLAGWLYHTARRLAFKSRMAAARRLQRENQAKPRTVADPLQEISAREAQTVLAEELDRLETVYREPLLLCLYEGATQDDAARQLGCSLNTVKRRLERGREILARRLASRGLAPAGALALSLFSPSAAPALLVQRTIAAATMFAAGHTMPGAVAMMAHSVLRAMFLKKALVCAVAVFALSGFTVAGGLVFGPRGNDTTAKVHSTNPTPQLQVQPPPVPPKEPPPLVDRFGDPLPHGALSRLGSLVFRHESHVRAVAFAPDGKCIASTSSDGYLRLWDASTGKERWQFPIERPDYQGQLAVSGDSKRVAALGYFKYFEIDADSGKCLVLHEWPQVGGDDNVNCFAIAPSLTSFARGYFDGSVRIYDAAAGKEVQRIKVADKAKNEFPLGIAFSRDNRTVYVGVNSTRGVTAYDVKSGKPGLKLGATQSGFEILKVSANQKFLAAVCEQEDGQRRIPVERTALWDLATGKQLHVIDSSFVNAFSPDGKLLAAGTGNISLYDTATGKELTRWPAPSVISSLAFSPDGKTLAGGHGGGHIILWEVSTGKLTPPIAEPMGIAYGLRFSLDGKQLSSLGNGIDWWDVESGKPLRHMEVHEDAYRDLEGQALSPDERVLAVPTLRRLPDAALQGDVLLVDTSTRKTFQRLSGHKSWAICTTFSPDGSKVFTAGGYDPRAIIWDVKTGKQLHILESHKRSVDTLALSPDGRWLATSSPGAKPGQEDFDIRLWEVATGKLARRLTPRQSSAAEMVFSPDSSKLISLGAEILLWDIATGKELRVFQEWGEGPNGAICVAISSDNRMLAVGDMGNLWLYEIATGTKRRRIPDHKGAIRSVEFSKDNRLLAAASPNAPIYVWDVYATSQASKKVAKLAKTELEPLWQRLGDVDATAAFDALSEFVARPEEAIAVFEEGWRKSPRATGKQIQEWIADLGSEQFAVRKKATVELEEHTAGHEELIRKALEQSTTLEVRQRLENILNRSNPERLRRMRMVEALERIGTATSRQLLQMFRVQVEDAQLAEEATRALKRAH